MNDVEKIKSPCDICVTDTITCQDCNDHDKFSKNKIDYTELAITLSKVVHCTCKDVPHDIGVTLANIVKIINKDE